MKSHSKIILILFILCNIAAITGYYFLFQYIKTQTEAASSLISTIDLSQQKDGRLNSLRTTVKDTEGKRQQLATLLLPSGAEVSFIDQIEILAKTSGLVSKTSNVSSVAGDVDSIQFFKMQLDTTGNWNDTMYFLSQIENLPYDIHVQGVSINKQSATSKAAGSSWLASFDISVAENK